MTDDLPAIDMLAKEWDDAYDRAAADKTSGYAVPRQEYFDRGEHILRMYEAEIAKAPDDPVVAARLAHHLARMADSWFGFVHREIFAEEFSRIPGFSMLREMSEAYASKACGYAARSFGICPNPGAARTLATLFETVGLAATAVHWLEETERTVALTGAAPDVATWARAKRLDLQARGPARDPVLTRRGGFPTRETPGVVLTNQPPAPPPPAPIASGSRQEDGKRCFVATACYGSCDHPDVQVFRQFRDKSLMPSRSGRMAVSAYYAFSPWLANGIRKVPLLTAGIRRVILEPLAESLRSRR